MTQLDRDMRTFAQALDLHDDPKVIEEYKRHHREVWPAVVAALRGAGIASMQIYLSGSRLFMIFEAPDWFDPGRDFQKYAADPECRRWDELMRTFQKRVPGASGDGWWAPMELVFDLEWGDTRAERGVAPEDRG